MLNDQVATLNTLAWEIANKKGMASATEIADEMLPLGFPRSLPELQLEGGVGFLREGLIKHLKDLFKRGSPDDQLDLSDIDPEFGPIVARLPKAAFYVPSLAAYVPISKLIAEPKLLNEARKHTRRKGEETIATADLLDQLYAAVTA